jgi:hypothetical protein
MKKLFTAAIGAAIATLLTASVSAQTPFFLNKVGAQAEYVMKDAEGKPQMYTTMTVKSINAIDSGNYTIIYSSELFSAKKKPQGKPVEEKAEVKNGTVVLPSSGTMKGVTVEGNTPSYPADLAVGQTFEYAFTMKIMGVSCSAKGKETVVARENITTPAGTFDCYRIENRLNTNVMKESFDSRETTWISAGIGAVKSEAYADDGKVLIVQELISLK